MMAPITLFTWGYWGWGNATPQFVKAADALESSRGFRPPLFVDIRFQRSVRASGFQGAAFEKLVGESRYEWLKSLGNEAIADRTRPRVRIHEPQAAGDLLDLAEKADSQGRRLIFFCACEFPQWDGQLNCHRRTVANLVLGVARRRDMAVEIVEWPGGEPTEREIKVSPEMVRAVRSGKRQFVPLGHPGRLEEIAVLPWGSAVTLRDWDDEGVRIVTGPAS